MLEEWRDVPGYEGLYLVSSEGRVKSMARKTTSGKILMPQLNNSGYWRVGVTKNGWHKYLYIHHLVAYAFLGTRPDKADINHINGIKTDNRVGNLEYLSRTENMAHARQAGLHDNRGEKHYGAKLTADLVTEIRSAHRYCGVSAREMAQSIKINVRTISDVLENKTWRHVPWL